MGESGLPLKITKLGEQDIRIMNMSLPQTELKQRVNNFLKLEKKIELKAT